MPNKKDVLLIISMVLLCGGMGGLGSSFVSVYSSPPLLLWGLSGLIVLGGGGLVARGLIEWRAEGNARKVWYRDHRVTFCLVYFLLGCNTIYTIFFPVLPLSYVSKTIIFVIELGLVIAVAVLAFVNYRRATKDSEENARKL